MTPLGARLLTEDRNMSTEQNASGTTAPTQFLQVSNEGGLK